ncbi:ABC transporter substrate-binding protein [Corticibacter populi]|uniref:ABC transporter substrate-binding protein n=2 Tax=Corticibacter populi TaxID=1550736 RepID=A0A3M6QV39_9BURK|nr:ABC transporter substrate-binding protein [Corticibacter populi]
MLLMSAAMPVRAADVAAPAQTVAEAGVTVTDDRGRPQHFDQAPMRIVSLLPSLTESVCALGACGRLVAVDRYSEYPPEVRQLPQAGGGLDPSIESVVAQRPDVVLISAASRATERLEALGLRTVVLEPKTHADVERVLQLLEALLQVPAHEGRHGAEAAPTAAGLWRRINDGVDAAAASLPPAAAQWRVYLEVSRGPYAAGPDSFIGQTLQRLGVQNVVPAELGPFPRLSPEYVLRADPDVILISNRSMQADYTYPGWHNMRAIRAQRLCLFDAEDSNVLVRPGPRMDLAARLMADCIRSKMQDRDE